jgi:hypothetical protein
MVGAALWALYGFLIGAVPVIGANVLVFSAAGWTLRRRQPSTLGPPLPAVSAVASPSAAGKREGLLT